MYLENKGLSLFGGEKGKLGGIVNQFISKACAGRELKDGNK